MKKLSAIVFSYFFGATFILSLPIWVGAIVEDYSLSERTGGFIFASLDPSGKLNGMGLAFAVLGTSLGPSYGGLLLADQEYALLGWFALLPWLLGLVLLLPAARKAERIKRTGGTTI